MQERRNAWSYAAGFMLNWRSLRHCACCRRYWRRDEQLAAGQQVD
jgi:hypothetical protein